MTEHTTSQGIHPSSLSPSPLPLSLYQFELAIPLLVLCVAGCWRRWPTATLKLAAEARRTSDTTILLIDHYSRHLIIAVVDGSARLCPWSSKKQHRQQHHQQAQRGAAAGTLIFSALFVLTRPQKMSVVVLLLHHHSPWKGSGREVVVREWRERGGGAGL